MSKKKTAGKIFAILGAVFLIMLPIGVFHTVFGFIDAFFVIKKSGVFDPKLASGAISMALVSSVLGFMCVLPSIFFQFVSIIGFGYREKWVFWPSVCVSILSLLMFPIGTLLGITLLVFLIRKKGSFKSVPV